MSCAVRVSAIVPVPAGVTLGLAVSEVFAIAGGPAVKVTVAGLLTLPAVAVTVMTSAFVDVSAETKTPEVLVEPLAGVKVLPVPVPVTLTAWLEIGLPLVSLTVKVSVMLLELSAT